MHQYQQLIRRILDEGAPSDQGLGHGMKQTTKTCHRCGGTVLREFRSLNYKQCHDCGLVLPWNLDPGQKPLVGPSRDNAYREETSREPSAT